MKYLLTFVLWRMDHDFDFTVTSPGVHYYSYLRYGKKNTALRIYDLSFKVLLCIVPINMVDCKTRCSQLLL